MKSSSSYPTGEFIDHQQQVYGSDNASLIEGGRVGTDFYGRLAGNGWRDGKFWMFLDVYK